MLKRLVDAPVQRVVDKLAERRRQVVLAHVRGKVLDIGCGANRLVRQYGNGVGVDVYDWGDVDLVVADTARLPFADRSFDCVTFLACLNHIPNRQEVLREAYRLLKDDGRLLITMIPPLLSRVWHKLVAQWDEDQAERGMKPGEVWGLRPGEIRSLLQGAGFTLVGTEAFVFRLNKLYIAAKASEPSAAGRTPPRRHAA